MHSGATVSSWGQLKLPHQVGHYVIFIVHVLLVYCALHRISCNSHMLSQMDFLGELRRAVQNAVPPAGEHS